ncbi:MAG: helix-turn-helix domain-containing protein, partial [Deltaproteobacteria bacterium]|nr:helix-turn-helix domain-containing protein [Deltaproteobacteria bacterium]
MKTKKNNLTKIREEMMISKSELARRAGVSPITIDRIENGMDCRVDTKRKIILALGLKLSDRDKVFGSERAEEEGEQTDDGEKLTK